MPQRNKMKKTGSRTARTTFQTMLVGAIMTIIESRTNLPKDVFGLVSGGVFVAVTAGMNFLESYFDVHLFETRTSAEPEFKPEV